MLGKSWVSLQAGVLAGWKGGEKPGSCAGCLLRRRAVRAAVQEQPVPPDLRRVPGNGRPLRGILPDLPQHAR